MNSLERVMAAVEHKTPDRVPIDFAGHLITGIHIEAYKDLLRHLGMSVESAAVERYRQRTAVVREEILTDFQVDFRPLVPPVPSLIWFNVEDKEGYVDEFGVTWMRNLPDGLYFENAMPFYNDMPEVMEDLDGMSWPDYSSPHRIKGLAERAGEINAAGKVSILDLPLGLEIFDAGFNICGAANFYMLLSLEPEIAAYMMDKQLQMQIDWWTQAIKAMPELRFVRIGDDFGSQESMLVSPEMYRTLVLPRHKKLFAAIKKASEGRVKIIMHSDGAIKPIIPDFIEAGIDCLNPLQYSVAGMEPKELKKEFGSEITFWGGGIDTQEILPKATVQQVKDEVKKQIDILAPGGGFIFSQIHIIQKGVPPENIIAMLEAAIEFGAY